MRQLAFLFLSIAFLCPLPLVAHQDPELAGYVDVPGGQIWYRLNGRQHLGKKAALVVAHGGPGSSHRHLMPYVELADERTVVLYDQLDSGNSTRNNQPEHWTVERFVSEIDSLRRALGLADVIIAGSSWGGTLAAEYGVRNPTGLKAIVLSSPLISTPHWIADNSKLIDELPPETRDTIRRHIASGKFDAPEYRAAEKAFYARHLCRPSPCPSARYTADGPRFNPQLYVFMWGPSEFHSTGTLRDYDISPRLHEIRVPTLMICGEFDEARPESCRKFAANVVGSRTVIIPNASHNAQVEDKAAYLESVRSFLRQAGL